MIVYDGLFSLLFRKSMPPVVFWHARNLWKDKPNMSHLPLPLFQF